MTTAEIFDKMLEITQLEFNDFAMECRIVPNSLKVAINREKISPDVVAKIHDRFGFRKDFILKGTEPIYDEKHTPVQNGSDNKENPPADNLDEILDKVESSRDYFVIPRAVLKENYRLVALEHFQLEKEKLERERDEMKRQAEKDRVYLEAQIEANRDLSRKLDMLLAKFTEVQKSQ